MSKKDPQGLEGSSDNGITVVKDGKSYQVVFDFSSSLVNKINKVTGATFDKDNSMWVIPSSNGSQLTDVIADMRDFVANNGVQVKPLENGGVGVLFDFNQELNQVIAAVAGATFNKESYIWEIPADSKALTAPSHSQLPYLDHAINKMRGLSLEIAQNLDEIKNLAAASALTHGFSNVIRFPEKEQSYTGTILNVNARFAAQAVHLKDPEGRPPYLVVHSLSDLRKPVIKGDDLRIDYDKLKKISNVRTPAVYQQQQTERLKLTELAATKVDGAKVINASMQNGAIHNGVVVEVTDHFLMQHLGRDNFAIHRLDSLNTQDIAKGSSLEIRYNNKQGTVIDLVKQKSEKALGR